VRKQKSVSVKVKVPKELRKRLKREAEEQGITVDELIARRLGA
jgi:predicted HicB family RNase H-like nuclease